LEWWNDGVLEFAYFLKTNTIHGLHHSTDLAETPPPGTKCRQHVAVGANPWYPSRKDQAAKLRQQQMNTDIKKRYACSVISFFQTTILRILRNL
jgi:hypothetical protein